MVRVVAAVEGGDARGAEVEPLGQLRGQYLGAQVRMPRQQAEGGHHVRLAAAHRLGQLEGGLIGLAGQAQQALAEQRLHAGGDVVAGEEGAPVAFVGDEVREVLDGLGHPIVVDHRMNLAGVTNGSEHGDPLAPLACASGTFHQRASLLLRVARRLGVSP